MRSDYLTKMRFLKRVEPADVSAEWARAVPRRTVHCGRSTAAGLLAPTDPAAATAIAIALPDGGFVRRMPNRLPTCSSSRATRCRRRSSSRTRRVPLRSGCGPSRRCASRPPGPRLGLETDHRTIPHEVGWIGAAVHLDKGCYRGQETVARVHNLGRPPRRLVLLHLSGESDVLPAPGTPVELDGRAVGFLGTAVHHYELGPIALAVIKRSLPDDAPLVVAGRRSPSIPSRARVRAQTTVLAAVAAGGVVGSEARYGLSDALPRSAAQFPWATLIVNTTGCLAIGALMVLLLELTSSHHLVRPFLGVGVLGGYTTFSTFAVEADRLVRADRPGIALLYVTSTAIGCMLAVWVGTMLAQLAGQAVMQGRARRMMRRGER